MKIAAKPAVSSSDAGHEGQQLAVAGAHWSRPRSSWLTRSSASSLERSLCSVKVVRRSVRHLRDRHAGGVVGLVELEAERQVVRQPAVDRHGALRRRRRRSRRAREAVHSPRADEQQHDHERDQRRLGTRRRRRLRRRRRGALGQAPRSAAASRTPRAGSAVACASPPRSGPRLLDRLALARRRGSSPVDVLEPEQDHRDVVAPARVVGGRDQLAARRLERARGLRGSRARRASGTIEVSPSEQTMNTSPARAW